jgi:DNA-directed RNA polymerase specialized sigma24 family protein
MLHLDGYSNTEISEIAGISKVNTGVKLHRIKQTLTEILTR